MPPAPGISAACFAPERERAGPGDYKIWHTTSITTGSVGRGWSVPADMIGPPLLGTVNDLAGGARTRLCRKAGPGTAIFV